MSQLTRRALPLLLICTAHLLGLLALAYGLGSSPPTPPQAVISAVVLPPQPLPVVAPPSEPTPEPPKPQQSPTPPKPAPLPPLKNAPPAPDAITAPATEPQPVQPEVARAEAAPTPPAPPAPPTPPAVVPPRSDAAHLNNPAPAYPTLSRKLGEQGRVLLSIYVLADGTVGEIKLKQSSGFSRLDEVALSTVKRWKFVPARQGDNTIAYWYVQPLNFSLNAG